MRTAAGWCPPDRNEELCPVRIYVLSELAITVQPISTVNFSPIVWAHILVILAAQSTRL
jgi:hypothetical protein